MISYYAIFYLQIIFIYYSVASTIITKAAIVANSVYKYNIATSVVWWRSDPNDVEDFFKEFQGSAVVTPIQNSNNHTIFEFMKAFGYKQTVLFATEVEEIMYFMTQIKRNLVIPIRLILVLTKPVTQKYELSKITRTAWNNDFVDIIIVRPEVEDEDISLFTYFPYRSGVCGDYTPVKFKPDATDLLSKKFKNFHRCPIKLTVIADPPYVVLENHTGDVTLAGMDGNILMFVIENLNSSLVVVPPTVYGGKGNNSNITMSSTFDELFNRRADMLLPAALINYKRYHEAQISHIIKTADILWFGPRPREYDKWLKVLFPFFTNMSLYFLLALFLFMIVTMLFKRSKFHKTVSRDSLFFQSFIIFLGQSVKFETKSSLINSLFVVWIWFCLIIRIVYQGELVDGLQNKLLERPLTTFEEAVKVLDGYGGSETLRDYYISSPSIARNYEVLYGHDTQKYVKDISNGKRFLLVTEISLVQYLLGNVQVLNEPVVRAPACLFMRPGWSAAQQVNDLLSRAIETGFVEKIFTDFKLIWLKEIKRHEEDRHARPMDFSMLIGCFYGLGFLYLLCFVIFIIEIVYYKLKNCKSHC